MWDDYRHADLRDAAARSIEAARDAQRRLDEFEMNLADPPPTNTCVLCKFKDEYRCGRNKVYTGFDPASGNRMSTRYEQPAYHDERDSRAPWRCGPKGRFFKSWSEK